MTVSSLFGAWSFRVQSANTDNHNDNVSYNYIAGLRSCAIADRIDDVIYIAALAFSGTLTGNLHYTVLDGFV